MIKKKQKAVAIIGFAKNVPILNRCFASLAARAFTKSGFIVCAGNLTGTFKYAFSASKRISKNRQTVTVAFIDQPAVIKPRYVDYIFTLKNKELKHQCIADYCDVAIIIGGGTHSLHLIECFIALHKPVIAVRNSKGIVRNEIEQYQIAQYPLRTAIHKIINQNL